MLRVDFLSFSIFVIMTVGIAFLLFSSFVIKNMFLNAFVSWNPALSMLFQPSFRV